MITLLSVLHSQGVGGKVLTKYDIYYSDTLLATAPNQLNFGLVELSLSVMQSMSRSPGCHFPVHCQILQPGVEGCEFVRPYNSVAFSQ
jgi:hypothetical protein